jgi:N-acetylneuraminate lyase
MRPQDLADFYAAIAHHASVPLVAYYFPAFTGTELSIDQLEHICRIPGVTGVKFTDYDLYKLSMLARRNIAVFNGRDEVLAAGLLMGASGGIGSIYNVVPHRFAELFRMASSGQWEEARLLQQRINQLITVLLSFPLLPAIKQVLGWSGIQCGKTLKSPSELTPEQKEELRRELQPLQDLLAA